MSNTSIQIWQGPNGIIIPGSAKEPSDIVPFAHNLSEKQKAQIVSAFQIGAYDMAAEYTWRKAMVKLKETISTLGMKFIGEMLGRSDIDESSPIENVLTDFTTIQLAEQLGVIGPTAALKLKHADEVITHFFSKNAEYEIDYTDAFVIVKSSVQYILGEQDISIAIEFSKFRDRLLNESLKIDDPQVEQLIGSPLFYLRTAITILITSIKNDIGARLEHSLANLNLLIKPLWENLGENDKWNIGTVYRDVTAAGNLIAASGVKNALLKVNGFDFVPENLRSVTFKTVAKELLTTHFGFNNFYNEPSIAKKLANLGTTIPAPALIECIQAYLAIYIGNRYGTSTIAARTAEEQLCRINKDRWEYYFMKAFHKDDVTLSKMGTIEQMERFRRFLNSNKLNDFSGLPKDSQLLYNLILSGKFQRVKELALEMHNKLLA
jgi:hypothetical protein